MINSNAFRQKNGQCAISAITLGDRVPGAPGPRSLAAASMSSRKRVPVARLPTRMMVSRLLRAVDACGQRLVGIG